MRILIIGGSFAHVNGYANAVKSLSKALNNIQKVYMLPLFPIFLNNFHDPELNDLQVLEKKFSFLIMLKMLKNLKKSLNSASRYVNPLNINFWRYLLVNMYHKAILELYLSKIKPDIINVHALNLDTWSFIDKLMDLNYNYCVTIHTINSGDKNIKLNYNGEKFEKDALNKLIGRNIKITLVSRTLMDSIKKDVGVKLSNYEIIHNGVDLNRFNCINLEENINFKKKLNIPPTKKILLQVASLSKRKNQIAVLQAISKMPTQLREKIYYIMVGEGPERGTLEKFIEKNQLRDSCLITGILMGSKLEKIYCAADFFILPSTSEGLPLVFLEALAANLPIITYAELEGVKDIYDINCFQLIDERTHESIINAIKISLERKWNKDKIKSHSQNWSWTKASNHYLDLYKNVINQEVI